MNVASGSSKGCNTCLVRVVFFLDRAAHGILFLARKLARSLKIDPKVSIFAFIIFTGILDRINVEGHSKPLDRQNDCLCLTINENLWHLLVIWGSENKAAKDIREVFQLLQAGLLHLYSFEISSNPSLLCH